MKPAFPKAAQRLRDYERIYNEPLPETLRKAFDEAVKALQKEMGL